MKKILLITLFFFTSFTVSSFAHCDGIDGPVVTAAKEALENNDITPVLIWIQEEDEKEVIEVFEKTLEVRNLSDEAKELADTYFFETVVRLHREGEGESFTGLKPAGRDLGPVIPLADESIKKGSAEKLNEKLLNAVNTQLTEKFNQVNQLKNYNKNDIHAGRGFVKSYVEYLHFAERLHDLLSHAEHNADSNQNHEEAH